MLKLYGENTNTRRFASHMEKPKKSGKRIKSLSAMLPKRSGRLNGTITVRHQGGRHKRYYREVDFRRDKLGVEGEVVAFEYDPNRNVNIALINYSDGEKRFILAPKLLKIKDKIISDKKAEIKIGNAMQLRSIPIGTILHNVEAKAGSGGQIGRSAGVGLTLQAKESGYAHLKMPSSEIRMIPLDCFATIGALGNEEAKNINLGKAGRSRHMGIRPSVRGTAMDPDSHPHGGGEGRSGIGRKKPMTAYGRPAVGNTRKKNKWTSRYILKRRR